MIVLAAMIVSCPLWLIALFLKDIAKQKSNYESKRI
jgi:hypothetical protein